MLSAALFLPPFFLITRHGGVPFALLVGAVALCAAGEVHRIARAYGAQLPLPLSLAAAAALLLTLYRGDAAAALAVIAALALLSLVAQVSRQGPARLAGVGGSLFSLFYAALLPGYLILLREIPRHGGRAAGESYAAGGGYVFLLFLMVWGCDTGAYFTGRAIGSHKLAPSISPGKTVEGAVGGLAAAVGGAFLAGRLFFPAAGAADLLVLGTAAGILAQAGDLAESALKRGAAIKDSARWIPGHGGVLDRFDGILFAAPFVYYYIRYSPFGWPGGTP